MKHGIVGKLGIELGDSKICPRHLGQENDRTHVLLVHGMEDTKIQLIFYDYPLRENNTQLIISSSEI